MNWWLQVFTGSSWVVTPGPVIAGCARSRSGSWRPTCLTPSSPRARRRRGWRTNSLPNWPSRSSHARRTFSRHPDLLKPMQVRPVIWYNRNDQTATLQFIFAFSILVSSVYHNTFRLIFLLSIRKYGKIWNKRQKINSALAKKNTSNSSQIWPASKNLWPPLCITINIRAVCGMNYLKHVLSIVL